MKRTPSLAIVLLLPMVTLAKPTVTPQPFDAIVVHTGAQLVAKHGKAKVLDQQQTQLNIDNHTLHIHGKGSIALKIPYTLSNITLEDGADAYFDQIKTKELHLINQGEGRLVVHTTKADIAMIKNQGKGTIDAYAIDSNKLSIVGLNGTLHLAGQVKHMNAELTGKTLLNGKNLHVRHAWIRTQEEAAALIHPTQSLNAYAINDSQIAYNHRLPDHEKLIETHNMANVFYVQHPSSPKLAKTQTQGATHKRIKLGEKLPV